MDKKYKVGTQHTSMHGETCTITEECGRKSLVYFGGEFPHQKLLHNSQLHTGLFAGDFRRSVYGTGIYVPYKQYCCREEPKTPITRAYNMWSNMLKRAYCPEQLAVDPTYTGTTVYAPWHRSDVYWQWAEKQVGWLKDGYHQDKDILFYGNKVYSPETCVFIPNQLNTFLSDCRKVRSPYGQGVLLRNDKYTATIWNNNKPRRIGTFITQKEAQEAFAEEKTRIGREWGQRLKSGEFDVDQRVVDRMLTYIWIPNKREDIYASGV